MEHYITETENFLKVKKDYTYFFEAVKKIEKKYELFLLIDFTGKAILTYNLKKLKRGFEKNKSASFFHESISDQFYKEKFKASDKSKMINSLSELIASRLELPKNGIKK
jgi:hypothetical protein